MEKPYDDPDLVRHYYLDTDYTTDEICDKIGCSSGTLYKRLDEFDIPRERNHKSKADDIGEDTLRRLYHDECFSIRDIASKYDVSTPTAADWLDRFGIETRQATTDMNYVPYEIDNYGYMQWRHYDGEAVQRVKVHRLIAVAEHGFEAVSGMDVHHDIPIPWLNYADNLTVMEKGEHTKHHYPENRETIREAVSNSSSGETNPKSKLSKKDVLDIREQYNPGLASELAEEYGVSKVTIYDIVNQKTWQHI